MHMHVCIMKDMKIMNILYALEHFKVNFLLQEICSSYRAEFPVHFSENPGNSPYNIIIYSYIIIIIATVQFPEHFLSTLVYKGIFFPLSCMLKTRT